MKRIIYILFSFIILSLSVVNAADDWTLKSPSSNPSSRKDHAMAYICGNKSLLFGGRDASGRDDESWVYDLSDNTWNQKTISGPSVREYHAMAYISGNKALLFGGYDSSNNDETWVYDLIANTWTNKEDGQSWTTGVSKPSARYGHAMAYIGGDQVILFGGWVTSKNNETWLYDLGDNTWTKKNPLSKPSARNFTDIAYIGGEQILLFGGDDGTNDDETWLYDLSKNAWTRKYASKPYPSARHYHAMAYIGGDQVLMFGGYDGASDDETWVYDLSDDNWSQDDNTTQPSARYAHKLSETSMDGSSYLVLFGGTSGGNQTWTFGGGDYSLPVELSSFTATAGVGKVTLSWITESEIENLGFNIYCSANTNFKFLIINDELIPGAGNSSQRHDYEYVDKGLTNGVKYRYKLEDVDYSGNTELHGPVSATPMKKAIPKEFRLYPNYPNPFNPFTTISYDLPEEGYVELSVYNMRGEKVTTLMQGNQEAGSYRLNWDGTSQSGDMVSSGIYFLRIASGNYCRTSKMVFIR